MKYRKKTKKVLLLKKHTGERYHINITHSNNLSIEGFIKDVSNKHSEIAEYTADRNDEKIVFHKSLSNNKDVFRTYIKYNF